MPDKKVIEGADDRKKKDNWEKADIILRPVGALITALTIALVGFFANYYISSYQEKDSKYKFLTEMESHRDDAESSLRRDMFNSIMDNILADKNHNTIDEKILQLELLAYNFHESLNLMPLFEYLNRLNNEENKKDTVRRAACSARLIKTADAAIQKQLSTLEQEFKPVTFSCETQLYRNQILDLWSRIAPLDQYDSTYYKEIVDPLKSLNAKCEGNTSYDFIDSVHYMDNSYEIHKQTIRIQVLDFDKYAESADITLNIHTTLTGSNLKPQNSDKHANFTVNHFEFPMIDNMRLENDMRLAVVLHKFTVKDTNDKYGEKMARIEFSVIYFPGALASLKQKSDPKDLLNRFELGK